MPAGDCSFALSLAEETRGLKNLPSFVEWEERHNASYITKKSETVHYFE
jgi:hypothetical protein